MARFPAGSFGRGLFLGRAVPGGLFAARPAHGAFARRALGGGLLVPGGLLVLAGGRLGGRLLRRGLLGARGGGLGGRLLLGSALAGLLLGALVLCGHLTLPDPAWPRNTRVGANSPSL